jgi:2-oxo-4-hydroxy-4-carboxy-5-ureidoimidazoline decarboxylase
MGARLSLADLAVLDKPAFVHALGDTFEHADWVAEAVQRRGPFTSVDALHGAMLSFLLMLPYDAQIAFFNQHPELAGKEAEAGCMTEHSTAEQSALGSLTRDELAGLRALNAIYRERHGFPFIIAARGHTKAQILEAQRLRVDRPTAAEVQEAWRQIALITRMRLDQVVG